MQASQLCDFLGTDKLITVSDLAHHVESGYDREPNFCMLLGAGTSVSGGISTGQDLVQKWKHELYMKLCPGALDNASDQEVLNALSLQPWYDAKNEYSSLFGKAKPNPKLRKLFVEEQVSTGTVSMGHAYLVRLAEQGRIRTFFTTNFDDLINEAFYLFSDQRPMVCAHDSSVKSITVASQRPNIIKLHGDYLFDGLKCDLGETEHLEKNMSDKFTEFLRTYGLIIVGYSGNDKSIRTILENSLASEGQLAQGLFWVFRPTDEISDAVLDILKKPNCYFVISEGFDELSAELFTRCCEPENPFTAKSTASKVAQVTTSFLENQALSSSQSTTIQKHLSEIDKHQESTALSNAIVQLQSAMNKNSSIPDKIVTILIDAEKCLYFRRYEEALKILNEQIELIDDPLIKAPILSVKLNTLLHMERNEDAASCADSLIMLDKSNYFAALKKSACLRTLEEKIIFLKEHFSDDCLHFEVQNEVAELCIEALQKNSPSTTALDFRKQASTSIESSLKLNPRYTNFGWRLLLNLSEDPMTPEAEQKEMRDRVFSARFTQAPLSRITLQTLYSICKTTKAKAYKGISVVEQARKSFDDHYPKRRGAYFSVVSEICCEHEEHLLLRYFFNECEKDPSLIADPQYIEEKISLQYNVYRDIDSAIAIAEEYCNKHPNSGIETRLFRLYLAKKDIDKATELFGQMALYISKEQLAYRKSNLLAAEGRYADAIDAIQTLHPEEFFLEDYTSDISYYHLRNKNYTEAKKACKTLLDKHNFATRFQAEIINYEFARTKLGEKASKQRLADIAKDGSSPELIAVAKLLQGNSNEALEILKAEGKKRLSNLDGYLEWPVIESIKSELQSYRQEIIEQRRSVDSGRLDVDGKPATL